MGYVAIIPNDLSISMALAASPRESDLDAAATPRWIRDEDMVFRRLGDEMVLVPVRKGLGDFNSFYVLNEVGAVLWEALAAPTNVSDLVTAIMQRFAVADTEARRDVEDFVQQLSALKAIRPAQEGEQK